MLCLTLGNGIFERSVPHKWSPAIFKGRDRSAPDQGVYSMAGVTLSDA
jgi:hypothetical protein